MGKTMAAFLFSRARGSPGAIRSRSRLFTGNESDKAGKHDSIRCDRINVDIGGQMSDDGRTDRRWIRLLRSTKTEVRRSAI
jgi:hypothetical protein